MSAFRAARPVFRPFATRQFFAHNARNSAFRGGSRRFASSESATAQQSWFQRMWDSPIGLKTVHFWAPVMKWALVLAGISDFARPVEKLSVTQNAALTATGLIWTRWCLIIKPKNYLLAAVNFFLGMVGLVQISRIALHNPSHKKEMLPAASSELKEELSKA